MSAGKPDLPLPLLAELAAINFGIRGDIASMTGERDQNALIVDASGTYVLKVANLGEDVGALELQNAAMGLAARYAPLPPLPSVVPSRRGHLIECIDHAGQRYAIRLLTRLPGVPASRAPGSAELRREVGRCAAHLNTALLTLQSELRRRLIWDMTNAPQARQFLQLVSAGRERELLRSVLDDAQTTTLPHLARLPRQWIHNDLNLNNLLVSPQNPAGLCGIIDFGDMIVAPRIIELAIAAAHQCAREPEPLHAIGEVVSAYHSVSALDATEIALIPRVISLRLTMAVLIQRAHAATTPSTHFDLPSHAGFIRAVSVLTSTGAERCADSIRGALREAPAERSASAPEFP